MIQFIIPMRMIRTIEFVFFYYQRFFKLLSIFLFLNILLLGFLYMIGNYQNFLDESQIMILQLLEYAGFAGIFSGGYLILMNFMLSIFTKRIYFFSVVWGAVVVVLGIGFAAIAQFITGLMFSIK